MRMKKWLALLLLVLGVILVLPRPGKNKSESIRSVVGQPVVVKRAPKAGGQERPETPDAFASSYSTDEPVAALPQQRLREDLSLAGSTGPRVGEVTEVTYRDDQVVLPRLDHRPLVAEAEEDNGKNGRYTFALSREVDITPKNRGRWRDAGDMMEWSYGIESLGALSLNLAFTGYKMPAGGSLTLKNDHQEYTFTERENQPHGELWTPMLAGETMTLTARVPAAVQGDLVLELTKVNHGFRGMRYLSSEEDDPEKRRISGSSTQPCNIDVVCSAADNPTWGPVIDDFRDQIRGVGAYTLEGRATCSGSLINNTAQDGRPLFLTAEHCGITTNNARSMVVYWNFQNSRCRLPNSPASGRPGNGRTDQFNIGARLLADHAPTDVAIVELLQNLNPEHNLYLSGWNRRDGNWNGSIGIHHPAVAEKRFSYDTGSTAIDNWAQQRDPTTHFRNDYNFGITAGGSSGSPLFNRSGEIIGYLTGGIRGETCARKFPNWYGRLFRAWNGAGTTTSGVGSWLDPEGTGEIRLGGLNAQVRLSVDEDLVVEEGDAGEQQVQITVRLDRVLETSLQLVPAASAAAGLVEGVDYRFGPDATLFPGDREATITLNILGDTTPEEDEVLRLAFVGLPTFVNASDAQRTVTIRNDDYVLPSVDGNSSQLTGLTQELFEYRIQARNTPRSYRLISGPDGMTVNAESGLVRWLPPSVGTFNARFAAINPAGESEVPVTITVGESPLVGALGLLPTDIVQLQNGGGLDSGIKGWITQTEETQDMGEAARSSMVADGETASFSVTLRGPDVLSFWWKTDSEVNFDFLTLQVNGEFTRQITGNRPWEQVVVELPEGETTLQWSYIKDGAGLAGMDAGFVDNLQLFSRSEVPFLVGLDDVSAVLNADFDYTLRSADPQATFAVTGLPRGLTFDGVNRITGQATRLGGRSVTVTATGVTGKTATNQWQISVLDNLAIPLDTDALNFHQSGDGFWRGTTNPNDAFDQIDSVRSSRLDHGETVAFEADVDGPTHIHFYWRVSSQSNRDFLKFLVDGEMTEQISGETDWQRVVYQVPAGIHRLKWEYVKDGSGSAGEDRGFVDQIQLESERRPFVLVRDRTLTLENEPVRLPVRFLNRVDEMVFDNMPAWATFNEATKQIEGTPVRSGLFRIFCRANNESGETGVPFFVQVVRKDSNFAEALGSADYPFFRESGVPWREPTNGDSGLQSGRISHNQRTVFSNLVHGPGRLFFNWGVSSEENNDRLQLLVNGRSVAEISGMVDMEEQEVDLAAGVNQITWAYSKNEDTSAGRDRGRVWNVSFQGYPEFLKDAGLSQGSTRLTDDLDGDGYSLLEEYAYGGDPANGGSPSGVEASVNNNTDQVIFVFPSNPMPIAVNMVSQHSGDLNFGSWANTPTQAEPEDGPNQTRRLRLRWPKGDGVPQFFRMEVSPMAPPTGRSAR